MRLERNSLIAIALLFFAGCSANRQARQADFVSDSIDPVPMPIRHADQYDSESREDVYEYESAPWSGDRPDPSRPPVPPPVPAQEPVPAPPTIGVSRVKSVSWLRGVGRKSESNNCGDNACGDGCITGEQTHLPPEYFTEGCRTTPQTVNAPPVRSQNRTTLAEVFHGWNLRARTHRPKGVQAPYNSGEGMARDPGLIMPEGCNSSVPGRKSHRQSPPIVKHYIGGVAVDPGTAPHGNHRNSLAAPLREDGLDDRGGTRDHRYSPDDMLDLPSALETPAKEHSPQNVPAVPVPKPPLALPAPESATNLLQTPAIHPTDAPAALRPQFSTGTVSQIVQPPMWPRLGSAAATYGNAPAASPAPAVIEDASLPVIQPGRRI